MGLYAAFVDLTKAFDTVSRNGLWKTLARLGCPPKSLTILRQLHEGQQSQAKQMGHCRAASQQLQQRQAGGRSGPNIVLHLLQHHAP